MVPSKMSSVSPPPPPSSAAATATVATPKDPLGSSSASSTASGATSEDYEIVNKDSAAATAPSTPPPQPQPPTTLQEEGDASAPQITKTPQLDIVVGEGKEADLKENLEECLLTSSPEAENDQDEDDSSEHTVFHKIIHCGSKPIQQPKNEEYIQGQIRDSNQRRLDRVVTLSVPKSSEGLVHVRSAEDEAKTLIQKFPICRIIFFARGNADTEEAACFAFTCVHGETSEERHFITHIFRCEVPEAVSKVFVSFAQAFKRSNPVRVVPPENFHEQEPFLFELTLEVREREESKSGSGPGGKEANPVYEIVPRY